MTIEEPSRTTRIVQERVYGGPQRVHGVSWDAWQGLWRSWEGSWGLQNSNFSDFCNPYGVICTFSRAQHGTGPPHGIVVCRSFCGPKGTEGALRIVNNGPEWSRMVTWRLLGRLGGSLEILRGRMGSLVYVYVMCMYVYVYVMCMYVFMY